MLFLVLIVVIISLPMSNIWKHYEKVDKGIELCYWKLSYRRKFIRTLWMFPIAGILVICFHKTFQSKIWICVVTTIILIMLLIQSIYNYKKWKMDK